MKKFSLEEYLKNPKRKIVTRDGRDARIICTDRAGSTTKPVVALITLPNGDENIKSFWANGIETTGSDGKDDLFFATVKHEGWVNIYCAHSMSCGLIYQSEEKAKQEIDRTKRYITTAKIEWGD